VRQISGSIYKVFRTPLVVVSAFNLFTVFLDLELCTRPGVCSLPFRICSCPQSLPPHFPPKRLRRVFFFVSLLLMLFLFSFWTNQFFLPEEVLEKCTRSAQANPLTFFYLPSPRLFPFLSAVQPFVFTSFFSFGIFFPRTVGDSHTQIPLFATTPLPLMFSCGQPPLTPRKVLPFTKPCFF